VVDAAMAERIMAEIVRPTVAGMKAEGHPFKGVLFAGVMIGPAGPRLIEFNVRFGDPECQALMPRLMSDLLPALIASADGQLAHVHLRWRDAAALAVVMAARGYPGAYEKFTPIGDLAAAAAVEDVVVFHAGTAMRDGALVATGGRVLAVTACARDIATARARAYDAVDRIDWPGGFCRRDIGWRAIARGTGAA
jgi:phosphoribosylamine--glycine ligase